MSDKKFLVCIDPGATLQGDVSDSGLVLGKIYLDYKKDKNFVTLDGASNHYWLRASRFLECTEKEFNSSLFKLVGVDVWK